MHASDAVQRRLLRRAERKLQVCKIILVGDGCVGKTSLVDALSGKPFSPGQESTEGMAACRVEVRAECWDKDAKPREFEEQMAEAVVSAGTEAKQAEAPRGGLRGQPLLLFTPRTTNEKLLDNGFRSSTPKMN